MIGRLGATYAGIYDWLDGAWKKMESPEGGALFLGKPSLGVSGGEQQKWLQTGCAISLPTPPDPASSSTGRQVWKRSPINLCAPRPPRIKYITSRGGQRKVRVWVRAEVGCGWNHLPRCLNFHID